MPEIKKSAPTLAKSKSLQTPEVNKSGGTPSPLGILGVVKMKTRLKGKDREKKIVENLNNEDE